MPDGLVASGLSNATHVLADVMDGTITVTAKRLEAQPDLWTWDVEARDESGMLCAISSVLVAVRPNRR